MAHGYARGERSEPDPRDVVEAAARAAGLSVEAWLERAARDARSQRQRPRRRRAGRDQLTRDSAGRDLDEGFDDEDDERVVADRSRRPDFREPRAEALSEERVGRILDDALDAMQGTLRANEERTSEAIAMLARKLESREHQGGDRRRDNRVSAMHADIERGFGRRAGDAVESRPVRARQLEDRIADVVDLIEQRAKPNPRDAIERRAEPQAPPAPPADRHLERQIEALGERIEALTRQTFVREPEALKDVVAEPIDRLRDEIAKLHAHQRRSQPPAADLAAAFRALESKVGRLAAPADTGIAQLERHFTSLGDRMDVLAEKVAGLRPSIQRDLRPQKPVATASDDRGSAAKQTTSADMRIAEAMHALKQRLDALSQPQPALLKTFDRVEAIERKLDTIQTAPATFDPRLDRVEAIERKLDAIQTTPAAFDPRLDRLEALERKLDALQSAPAEISHRLDDIRALVTGRTQDKVDAHAIEAVLASLASQVQRLYDGTDHHAIERLMAEVQSMGRKLDSSAWSASSGTDPVVAERIHSIEVKLDALQAAPADLARRLDQLQAMMQARPAAPAASTGTDTLLRGLALRVEAMQSSALDDQALDRLHDDIRQISRKLEASPGAQHTQGLADLGGIERSISEVFSQLERMRGDMGEAAEQAARAAADEVMSRAAAGRGPEADEALRRQLTEIHSAQQEAEWRATATLGAVHDTLTRMVDRLVDLEQDIKAKPAPAAAPPFAAARAAAPAAPLPLRTELDAPPAGLESPAGQSLSIADTRAHRLGVAAPAAAEPAKAGLGDMFAAARGAVSGLGRGKGKPEAAPAPSAPAEADTIVGRMSEVKADRGAPIAQADPLDMPLEPGSGRPRVGQPLPAIDPNDPKASFLAAARRAAQSAAEQSAAALAESRSPGKDAKKAAPGRKSLSRKQIILLGLAALVVAVGASHQALQAPPKVEPQPDKTTNLDRLFGKPAASDAATAQKKATDSETRLAQAAPAPRQILPSEPPSAKPADRVADETRGRQPSMLFAPPEPAIVGAIGSSPARAPDAGPNQPLPAASSDPLLRFEGVVGAEKLKAAARAGDPSAFIELGNRHLEGKGAPRDPRTAALWFERAADFGSAPAQFRLGAMHREGRGIERNAKLAIKHFLAAAEGGNARAMYNTAVLLAEGVNGAPDYAAAGEWFKKAAEFGIRDAQYNLAILYARGLGLPQDLTASYAWFAAAAASGDEDSGKKRDEVAARLEPAKLAQAKAAAAAWKPKTPDPAANEVAVPAGGWDGGAAKQVPAAALGGANKTGRI